MMDKTAADIRAQTAKRKRTLVSAVIIFLLIPLTIWFGIRFLDDRKYLFISLLIILYTAIPFVMGFEGRRPDAREIVVIAVMAAIAACGNLAFFMLGPFQAGTALVIIAGICLGPEEGFLTGAMARLVINMFASQGPWTPWQMFCWGLLGFLAGLAFNRATVEKLKSRDFKVVMGPLLCVVFAVLTAYLLYLLFPPVDNGSFLGWRLYVFGAIGLLLGVLVQRKRLPVDDITLTVFTFFTTFIIYGGLMNICAMVTAASIPGGNEISWDTMKLLYISGVPYDAAHAGSAAIFNFIFGDKIIRKLERIKLKYGIYR